MGVNNLNHYTYSFSIYKPTDVDNVTKTLYKWKPILKLMAKDKSP